MTRRKVEVECLFCGEKFMSILRWEGVAQDDYCSKTCARDDADTGDSFEKFEKPVKSSDWR